MILYFTGTGNSRYVAKRISAAIHDECIDLLQKLRSNDCQSIRSDRPFVIVTPTYGWQIPHILRDWLTKTKLAGNSDIYFVMTCGSEIGNAAKYLVRLCKQIKMNFKGCGEIVMPENYIALFRAPEEAVAMEIIRKAEPFIDRISELIVSGTFIPAASLSTADRLRSGIVNAVYYPLIVHAQKFYATDICTGCGECVKTCVMHNIVLSDMKPKWSDNCTHCMACICGCPVKAIEYGNASKGKLRYQCPM